MSSIFEKVDSRIPWYGSRSQSLEEIRIGQLPRALEWQRGSSFSASNLGKLHPVIVDIKSTADAFPRLAASQTKTVSPSDSAL